MSKFNILTKDFRSTWSKIEPYTTAVKAKNGYDAKYETLLETAQKALYAFVCTLCNGGTFKAGLNRHINALDSEVKIGYGRSTQHKDEMFKKITVALDAIKNYQGDSESSKKFIEQQVSKLFDHGLALMAKPVRGYFCWS
jgi:hypothetical protein